MERQTLESKVSAKKSIKDFLTSDSVQSRLMISTMIIGFLVFTIYPITWTFRWAWYSYNGIPSQTHFVGWENFITFFTKDFSYWKSWLNTIIFTVCKIPLELTLAMIMALFLNRGLKGTGFFRSVYYLPSVISVVVVGLIFSNLFSYFGIINNVLVKLGIISENVDWFSTKLGAMIVLVFGSIWNTFGINVMYLLAALANVPKEVYESGEIDGATGATAFFKITLPMIMSVFKVIFMLSLLGTLGTNDYIIVLTGGGPHGSTDTVMSYLTQQFVPGFASSSQPALGYGCAMSVVTTILFALVGILHNVISNKVGSDI